jgi:hypothetical protein
LFPIGINSYLSHQISFWQESKMVNVDSDKGDRFQTFEAFWPYYLGEHRLIKCRALHYLGTVGSAILLIILLVNALWTWLPMVLVAGYGPAWIGHFFIERNRPATFTYPWWSLLGDYKMFYMAIRGELRSELSRLFGSQATS